MEREQVIEELKKVKENKVYKDLTVRNITIGDKVDEYQRISITLDKEVEQCVKDAQTGKVEHRMSNVVFTTTISAIAVLKESGAAFAANHIQRHLEGLSNLFCDSKIDIIQEFVKDGTEYSNPFSSKDTKTTFEGDRYITHIIRLNLNDEAKQDLRELRRSMMGININN